MRRRERPLILRPVTPHDFAEVQALFRHPVFEGWGGPGYRSDAQLRDKYLGARLPQVECFLIEVDDRVAGFTQLHADGSGSTKRDTAASVPSWSTKIRARGQAKRSPCANEPVARQRGR